MAIVISGANRGIGAGLAAHYAAAGAQVIGTSRGGAAGTAGATLDVTDPASIAAFAEGLGQTKIDTLICNAGVFPDRHEDTATGYAPELWARTFATNVTGVFLTVQALLPNLKAAPAPKIAIIASQMGSSLKAGGNGLIYRASKAAAINLGRNLAVDLKPSGIAVGIYHPGWVRTEMGGDAAAISIDESVAGLGARIADLGLETTGIFLNWDGSPQDY
ncbi:SDR family NAD(P)-dependent oxidoreductase [Rhodobacteraceae bacterium N5(2021)]|uniref:SDR family NAD(P)-dependent oxidoreductase n=1 Tax=Gymnodinialimonas phycosphaerae TaxID=2841589 RepID=A0A975TZM9_9RHOB|nr:SDR family NAD(P)-dependent oxidoreductase [Gymnodinialimonas phycosphaerae]MBY4892983.1 SDR family NAD(P)-dependent oxidoreductase [Gymnodinialimonas phycosphaerae]